MLAAAVSRSWCLRGLLLVSLVAVTACDPALSNIPVDPCGSRCGEYEVCDTTGVPSICRCEEGFVWAADGCVPAESCRVVGCGDNAACDVATGRCGCDPGTAGDPSGRGCTPIDPCLADPCTGTFQECVSDDGSCVCQEGYTSDATGECVPVSALYFLPAGADHWRPVELGNAELGPEPRDVTAMVAQPSEGAAYFITGVADAQVHRLDMNRLSWTESRPLLGFCEAFFSIWEPRVTAAYRGWDGPGEVKLRSTFTNPEGSLDVMEWSFPNFTTGECTPLVLSVGSECSPASPWLCDGGISTDSLLEQRAAWTHEDSDSITRNITPSPELPECVAAFSAEESLQVATAHLAPHASRPYPQLYFDDGGSCRGPVARVPADRFDPFTRPGFPELSSIEGAMSYPSGSGTDPHLFVWAAE